MNPRLPPGLVAPSNAAVLALALVVLEQLLFCAQAQCIVSVMGPLSVEGSPATSQQLWGPDGVASDSTGGFFVADLAANRIQQILANKTMVTIMGVTRNVGGSTGNGGPASAALLNGVATLSADGLGGIFLADRTNNQIRRVFANATVGLVAGNGTAGWLGDFG